MGGLGVLRIIIGEEEVAAEASGLAPALIDAVDGVVAIDLVAQGVDADVALAFVGVGIDEDVDEAGSGLLGSDSHHRRMAGGGEFGTEVLVGQGDGVVVGMGDFGIVAEAGGPRGGLRAEVAGDGSHSEGAVVLGATTYNPVAVAEALEESVGIVVGCDALLLGVLRLGCPEILAVGGEDSGQRLAVLLRALAEEAGRLGVGLRRAYHRVEGRELLQMVEAMKAVGNVGLDGGPGEKIPTPNLPSVANGGFAPLSGAAATSVAALKTPVARREWRSK